MTKVGASLLFIKVRLLKVKKVRNITVFKFTITRIYRN